MKSTVAWQYKKGLHEIGNDIYAYLQPNGGWGWNNAGLIVDQDQSLLVDTLFDVKNTAEMLDKMQSATHAAKQIETVINTHANGDHCWGNQLVADAEIITSKACAAEMQSLHPNKMSLLMSVAKLVAASGGVGRQLAKAFGFIGLKKLEALAEAAPFVAEIFGDFNFSAIDLTLPTQTFEKEKSILVGDKKIQLVEVGPAHTQGDVLVFVPESKVVYTGDILFADVHPIIWSGPISNWIEACDKILDMDIDVIVPGHGPISDKSAVKALKVYLAYLKKEAFARFESGMAVDEAALDISLDKYASWGEAERIVVNVQTLYREFENDNQLPDPIIQFAQMARTRIAQHEYHH